MKHVFKTALICAGIIPTLANAQDVDRTKYPDYTEDYPVDYSLLKHDVNSTVGLRNAKANETKLPDHHNSAEQKFFPPVFNQSGGSCGSASSVGYMFTHEMNAYRNLDGSLPENQYPTHFTWLFTRGNSNKDAMLKSIGVPTVPVYGGRTYSTLFGKQIDQDNNFGWMQGYDKWFHAMHNRTIQTYKFPKDVKSEEGRLALKHWLYNHNGDPDFHGAGGLAGIGVASSGKWVSIPNTPTNREIGVAGMKYVQRWGFQVDHALTIVGYDDRIEFDLNGNGIFGEKDADEVGAWIIVNSWGNRWCNGGFIYCPYAYGGPVFRDDGNDKFHFAGSFWRPVVHKVRKDYRPLRTIKIKMGYSRRSEICLNAGISTNLEAEMPSKKIVFEHFKYAGDGNGGKTQPAPEVPMLGKWADGKMHTEPMEFGYDLTDVSAGHDRNTPLKYFFIIETRDWAEGKGKIYNASIIDYEFNRAGIETPFDLNGQGVEIKNKGNKTIISTIVYGESYYAPINLSVIGNQLRWNKPMPSGHKITNYKIYCNDVELATVEGNVTSYTLPDNYEQGTYAVCAIYDGNVASSKVLAQTPVEKSAENKVASFHHSGFVIPNIFDTHYNAATIEFWIKPHSLANYNQTGGPGWGKFMFHTAANGQFYAGWEATQRAVTNPGTIKKDQWNHIAMVINQNALTVYVNGQSKRTYYSSSYSGIGGWGDFPFIVAPEKDNTDADIDEIRIWNYARSAVQIRNGHRTEFVGQVLPQGLIAYYKGDINQINGQPHLLECISGNHASISNEKYNQEVATDLTFNEPIGNPSAMVNNVTVPVYTHLPVSLTANYADVINDLKWTIPGADIQDLSIASPNITFNKAGKQKVYLKAISYNGTTLTDSCEVLVKDSPAANANFKMTDSIISAGQRVSFVPVAPTFGYGYTWSMPGADKEEAGSVTASATYSKKGKYTVTLTVTDALGNKTSSSQQISVEEVTPEADFDITPNIILKGETTFLNDKSKFTPIQWNWILNTPGSSYAIVGQNSSFTPTIPGVYSVELTAKNNKGTDHCLKEKALIVCNADSKNGLDFSNSNSKVTLKQVPIENKQRTLTVEWWMHPNKLQSYSLGIGDSEETFIIRTNANGAMELANQGKIAVTSNNFVIEGEWHHYAVTFSSGRASFYRDGNLITRKPVGRNTLGIVNHFAIGGTNAPMFAQIDELRIWKSSLSDAEIQAYANAPIGDINTAIAENNLFVYYDFNQNGGDVVDLTPNHNDGIRSGFGPDGDAWGLSRGVFCLNFNKEIDPEEVNSKYLKNFKAPFAYDDQKIHPSATFAHITDWTLENTVVHGDTITGVHVNKQKNNDFTFTSGWDDFAPLKDHKAYQTVTLPAGRYEFSAIYDIYEGNPQQSYVVAAIGKGLPDTDNLNSALAVTKMKAKTDNWMHNSVKFLLTEETEVSLGLVINTPKNGCCTIKYFRLTRENVTVMEADGANGFDLTVDNSGYNTLYLPYPTVLPEGVTAYVAQRIEGNEITLAPIEGKVVPAKTGVVIAAEAGNYHFKPSTISSQATSLLSGVLNETETDMSKRYYTFDTQSQPGFYLYTGSTLEANKAFLVRESNDTNESYRLNIIPVGIDEIITDSETTKIYDISGRRVNTPAKGVYISNGKKVLVK